MSTSKSNKASADAQTSADTQEKAASVAEEPQTAHDTAATTSTADNVLSASESGVIVGGVTVIEHEQDNGEANEAGGA